MAIDPLHHLLRLAVDSDVLMPVRARAARCRISLYANDARIFTNSNKIELTAINSVLECFGKASGLVTNLAKTEVFPIRCEGLDLQDILTVFPTKIGTFPGHYLGLPLLVRRPRKIHLQPLIDKINGRLLGWKGKNIARAGRVTLAKAVLTSTTTFHMTVIPLPKWAFGKINKILRGFVWSGDDSETAGGGHSLVN